MVDAHTQTQARFLNPWVLHLQKLGLELKCPYCLKLYKKPMLLPCDHIFCSSCVPKSNVYGLECPLCKLSYSEQGLREAPYMDNLVNIYRSLDASFSTHMLYSGRGLVQCPVPAKTVVPDQLPKALIESSSPGDSTSVTPSVLLRGNQQFCSANNPLVRCSDVIPGLRPGLLETAQLERLVTVDVDMNQMELSPDSPPSSGASKGVEVDYCNPVCSDATAGKFVAKKTENRCLGVLGAERIDEHHDSYCKKQKMNHSSLELPQDHSVSMNMNLQKKASAGSDSTNFKSTSVDQLAAESDSAGAPNFICAFCQRWKITQSSGQMHHFVNGKQVSCHGAARSGVIHLHQNCIAWAPQVYYKDDTTLGNLDKELARAGKLKCTSCGLKGAALGCYAKTCRRTYHAPCAYEIAECRWDTEDFLVFCPTHASHKFPSEKSRKPAAQKSTSSLAHKSTSHAVYDEKSSSCDPCFWEGSTGAQNWVICGSSLSAEEKHMLVKFANICGATVTKSWSPNVTHVIAATDANGACSRTLKVLMAVLKGKWILKTDWIKSCMELKHPVDEEPFEINLDNHGCCDGPRAGRIRASTNAPKLFSGIKFYFNGDFVPAYRKDLQDLILTAGGSVLESTQQLQQPSLNPSVKVVVYNEDAEGTGENSDVLQRQLAAEVVAAESGSQVVPHTWMLDSIASNKLQPFVQNKFPV